VPLKFAFLESVLDWNYLRTFHAVAETGSLTAAADRIGISHATAFRHIKAFEADLGSRLFEKVRGRYRLTEAGEDIVDLARTVAVSIEDIDRRISGSDIELKGRVRVTAPASFSCFFLPGLLAGFRSAFPKISVELLSSNEEVNMSNRASEIALRVTAEPPEHLIGRKIADIPWGVYGSEDYFRLHGVPETLEDLGEHLLIGATGALARRRGFAALDKDFRQRIVSRCDDLMAMAAFARHAQGLALLPADVAAQDLKLAFRPAFLPPNQLWLLTHPDLRHVERVRQVMRYLGDVLKADERLASSV